MDGTYDTYRYQREVDGLRGGMWAAALIIGLNRFTTLNAIQAPFYTFGVLLSLLA